MTDLERQILDLYNRLGRIEGWIEVHMAVRHDAFPGNIDIIDNPPQPRPSRRKGKNVIPFPAASPRKPM